MKRGNSISMGLAGLLMGKVIKMKIFSVSVLLLDMLLKRGENYDKKKFKVNLYVYIFYLTYSFKAYFKKINKKRNRIS